LGLPFLHANFGFPDDQVVPKSAAAHAVGDDLRNNFSTNAASTISIVIPNTSAAPDKIGPYAAALSRVDNISSVVSVAGTFVAGKQVSPGNPRMAIGDKT